MKKEFNGLTPWKKEPDGLTSHDLTEGDHVEAVTDKSVHLYQDMTLDALLTHLREQLSAARGGFQSGTVNKALTAIYWRLEDDFGLSSEEADKRAREIE